ncbi:MAG: heavy metal translocating P-type ATPase, partial [Erysipelothrix sp.]|nr:heavy metal translocating P-type ATPase [Erysipelothrix sp.]
GAGTLQVKVVGTGESGYLASVMKLVSEAQNDQSKRETLSQVVAKYLFYVALIVGILAFVIWYLVTKDINIALERLVTVLIIACPHALGLAIPLVVARSTSIGARNGLLIKNREAFENAHKVDIVLLDKTGTLTEGDFKVSNITSLSNSFSEDDILGRFSSLEESSSHPLAIGILNETKNRKLKYDLAEDVQTIAGIGLKGNLNSKELIIVNEKYLNTHNFDYNKDDIVKLAGQGNSISFIIEDNKLIGYIAQGDSIKESSYDLVKYLKERGIQVMMLTGDNEHFANLVSKELGLDAYYAQLMPEDKEKIVSQLQSSGKRIMMVGDGINDAPSLVRADVGVAIGVGTDIAIDSADIVLVKSKPSDILGLIDLSKKTSSKMVQNLWWGAGYNILAIPLAAGILAFAGIILTPALGAVLMSLSTVIVAMNAMLLKSI